jgi:hypothetical protein
MLGAATLLEVWESTQGLAPSARAQRLLHAALPHSETKDLLALTIGERDLCLLQWRKALFGSQLEIQTHCDTCRETLEATLDLDRFDFPLHQPNASHQIVSVDGSVFNIRSPKVGDVAFLTSDMENEDVIASLLVTCLTAEDGSAISAKKLESATIAKLAERMAEVDSAADIVIALNCPYCHTTSRKVLDIAHILFREIGRCARQLLMDIHSIASNYGWSENEILAMSRVRRRAYLDLIAQ